MKSFKGNWKGIILGSALILTLMLAMPGTTYITTASTVTITITKTSTKWETTTISQTIWRTSTYTSSVTSPVTITKSETSTISPTVVETLDHRSTTTIYTPTTTTIILTTSTGARAEIKIEVELLNPALMGEAYDVRVTVTNLGSNPIQPRVVVTELYDGDPNQMVGPLGSEWPLKFEIMGPSIYGPTDPQRIDPGKSSSYIYGFYNKWNWIKPAEIVDRLIDILLLILSIIFLGVPTTHAAVVLKEIINAIRAGKGGLDRIKGIILRKFAHLEEHVRILVRVENLGEVLAESKEISIDVPEWKKDAFLTWMWMALASMLLPIVGVILAAIALAILSGGGAVPAWITIAPKVVTVASGALIGASWAAYDAALDPPTNYLDEGVPEPPQIPKFVQDLPEGPQKNFAIASLNYKYFIEASSMELSRYSDAEEKGEIKYAILHLEKAHGYLKAAEEHLGEMLNSFNEFEHQLPELNSTTLHQAREYTESEGLPEDMRNVLIQMGLNDLESTIVKGIIGLPEQAAQIPISGLLFSTQSIIQNQTAEIEGEITNLRKKLPKSLVIDIYGQVQSFIKFLTDIIRRIEQFIRDGLRWLRELLRRLSSLNINNMIL